MKRTPQTELIDKRAWLTTAIEGHAHLVDEQDFEGKSRDAGDTSWTRSEGDDTGHSHPWVRDPGYIDVIVIGEAEGHTHEVVDTSNMELTAKQLKTLIDMIGPVKKKETKHMSDSITQEDHDAAITKMQADLDRVTAVASLSDAHKMHLGTLEGDAADGFVAKSADERQRVIDDIAKAAQDDDPVEYVTTDGVELRKSAGTAVIAIAKSNDVLRKENSELREQREQDALEKRADEDLAHIPGDVATRAAMLKAIDGIGDEGQREAALNALKAQNEAMSKAFDTVGYGGTPVPGSPDDKLDDMAKRHQEAHPDLTIEQASAAILGTPEGADLYAKSLN